MREKLSLLDQHDHERSEGTPFRTLDRIRVKIPGYGLDCFDPEVIVSLDREPISDLRFLKKSWDVTGTVSVKFVELSALDVFSGREGRHLLTFDLKCPSGEYGRWETEVRYEFDIEELQPRIAGYSTLQLEGQKKIWVFNSPTIRLAHRDLEGDWSFRFSDPTITWSKSEIESPPRVSSTLEKTGVMILRPSEAQRPIEGELSLMLGDREIARWWVRIDDKQPESERVTTARHLWFKAGAWEEAITLLDRRGAEPSLEEYQALVELAQLYRARGDERLMLEAVNRGIEMAQKLGRPLEEARSRRSLTYMYLKKHCFKEADFQLQQAVRVSEELQDVVGLVKAKFLRGLALENEGGRGEAARAQLEEALYEADLYAVDPNTKAIIEITLAAVYGEYFDYNRGIEILESMTASERARTDWSVHRAYLGLVGLELEWLPQEEAEYLVSMMQTQIERQGAVAHEHLVEQHYALGRLAVLMRDHELAQRAAQRAFRWLEDNDGSAHNTLRNLLGRAELATQQKETQSKLFDELQNILAAAPNGGGPSVLRASLLLAELFHMRGQDDEALRHLEVLDSRLSQYFLEAETAESRNLLLRRVASAFKLREQLLLNAGKVELALNASQRWRLYRVSAVVPDRLGVSPLALKANLERLRPRQAIWVREPHDETHFWITPNSIKVHHGDFQPSWTEIDRLYVIDAPPDIHDLKVEGVLVGARVEIVHLPHLYGSPGDPAASSGPKVLVGNPDRSLPWANEEVHNIARHLDSVVVLTEEEAARAQILSLLPTASLFHFAGHGTGRSRDPWRTVLHLSRGEKLTLEDWLRFPSLPPIIVLSACETGKAPEALGIELAEVLVSQGAQFVLVASTTVSDSKARDFMDKFYAAGGASYPPHALLNASKWANDVAAPIARKFRLWAPAVMNGF